jgi:hypothetical protein
MPHKRRGEEEGEKQSLDNNDNDIGDFYDVELSGYPKLRERLYLMRTRYLADEVHLQCVVKLHKGIIVETLRRRLDDLTETCVDIAQKLEECRDFLIDTAADC